MTATQDLTSYSITTFKVVLHSQLTNKAEVSTLIPNVCLPLPNNMFFAPIFLFCSMTYSVLKIPDLSSYQLFRELHGCWMLIEFLVILYLANNKE